MKLIKDVTFRV